MGVPSVGQVVLVPFPFTVSEKDFQSGALRVTSYARPGKLFTANASLIVESVGLLKNATVKQMIESVVEILSAGI